MPAAVFIALRKTKKAGGLANLQIFSNFVHTIRTWSLQNSYPPYAPGAVKPSTRCAAVIMRREALDPGQSLYGYLLRSVYNQSVNYVNKHRHACSYRSYYQERIESIGYAYYDPDRNPVIEKLYSQDLRTSINEAIAALPAKCREVFSLSYLQGFSHREISEQMGIAQSTVENHIYLALRQLRAKLSKSELILLLFFIFLQNNSHPLG